MTRRAFAPGRVNLIGDHTDYSGGLVLPMAIQMGTTATFHPGGTVVRVSSDADPDPARLPPSPADPSAAQPPWARYVAGVLSMMKRHDGGTLSLTSTLPLGAGLSSSASLELAVALALGFVGSALELAAVCQEAETAAAGVPCGIMDQLASASGVEGHALLIDCRSLEISPVPVPADCEIVAIHSGQARRLAGSEYSERRAACESAAAIVGPLRDAGVDDLTAIEDPVLRRRARHVVTENRRVSDFAEALRSGDLAEGGRLMAESHRSLRDDFDVSTPALDGLIARLEQTGGVYGARLTGAGFGGCVVALSEPGALEDGWCLRASSGAHLLPSP